MIALGMFRAAALGLTLSALGCGGGQPGAAAPDSSASEPVAAPKEPFDLKKEMAVEAEGLTERAVKSPDGAWSSVILGLGEVTVEPADSDFLVTAPVGPNAMVTCRLYDEHVDTAATFSSFFQEVGEKLEYKQFAMAPVQLHAGFPSVGITALYLADVEGSKGIGKLHTAVYHGELRSVLCWLDNIGYAQTFARVTASFFEGLRVAGTESAATFVEVTKTSLGDELDVGFSITTVEPGENAKERIYSKTGSSFLPRSATDLIYEDTYVELRVDAKGKTLEGTWVKTRGPNEITMRLTLTREKDGKLTYAGEVSGKPLSGALVAPKGLYNPLEVTAMLKRKLAKGGAFSETVPEYHPGIDPTALVQVTYSRAKDAPPRQVTMRLGERDFLAEVDDEGLPQSAYSQLGQHKLSILRQRVSGKL